MNEASVSSPLMGYLRKMLPGAVVVKHHDSSMIGLPDCSVTWRRKIAWLEFKLWVPPKRWEGGIIPCQHIAEASPTQHRMMLSLAEQATLGMYVIWAKKSRRVACYHPDSAFPVYFQTTQEVADYIVGFLQSV